MGFFLQCLLLVRLIQAQDSLSSLLGITQITYTGDMLDLDPSSTGYANARLACVKEYGQNARMCDQHDLAMIAQTDGLRNGGTYRYMTFDSIPIPSKDKGFYQSDDCGGYTSDSYYQMSNCVVSRMGGIPLPELCACNMKLSFLCCSSADPGQAYRHPLSKTEI
eukprot:gb/GEZN01026211.1/.p1 GENE.gb/GEZN01026211.1/~~gb/GEZN01026211.1/.p1  ORF type:complete len:172 (+),score=4.22 gb/GEZN01026211.1/:26-517(+)